MRALTELLIVFVTGVLAFLAGIALLAGVLVLWFCGLVSALMLMVSVVSGIGFAFTGNHHYGVIALVYLAYAAVPFALIVVLTYYHGKFTDALAIGRSFRRVGEAQLMQDEPFEAAVTLR